MTERRPESRGADFLAIVGPTAVGKTEVSLRVAAAIDGEIVSMDSRQVYRFMDVGTAKATSAERAAVPHHGLDLIAPSERYSAAAWAREARARCEEIAARGKTPIVVGGTGFYLRALTTPLWEEPAVDEARRARLGRYLEELPAAERARWVRELDPERAELAIEGGAQRTVRTLAVALLTGVPLSEWYRRQDVRPGLHGMIVSLEMDAPELDRRIETRVRRMMESGLIEEVGSLTERGFGPEAPGMTAVGYREILEARSGALTMDEARDAIVRATRQYARRQRTWFRNQLPTDTLRLAVGGSVEALSREIVDAWTRLGTTR